MATIFKRAGRETYTIEYTDATGERRRVAARTSIYKTACEVASKIESNVARRLAGVLTGDEARIAEHDAVPLVQHVDDYLRHLELRKVSPRYARDLRLFLAGDKDGKNALGERLGVTRLSEITSDAIERYLHSLKSQDLCARTLNWHRGLLGAFLDWCERSGRILRNPTKALRRQEEGRDRRYVRRALDAEEVERLLAVADARGRGAYYRCALWLGLRRSELARLTWGAIDLDGATCEIAFGKAKRTDVLPIAPPLLDALSRIKPALVLPSARVFDPPPSPKTRRADFTAAKIVTVDAEKRVADLHSLRATLATMCAREGIAPQIAMRLMRHASFATTSRHYVRLRVDDLAGAIGTLAKTPREAAAATGTDPVRVGSEMGSTHTLAGRRAKAAYAGAGICSPGQSPMVYRGPKGEAGEMGSGMGSADPVLARVVAVWPTLSEPIRAAIRALVEAGTKS